MAVRAQQPLSLRAWLRLPPPQHVQPARRVACRSSLATQELLDRFWLAQGVVDAAQRRRLVDAAAQVPEEGLEEGLLGSAPGAAAADDSWAAEQQQQQEPVLPGVMATWGAGEAAQPQVLALSRRLLALRQALGGGEGVDVVWMMVREPRLLTADLRSILRRLLEMRLAEGSADVVRLVEAQPALLLQDAAPATASGSGSSSSGQEEESGAGRLLAWQHGLASDGRAEWGRRLGQLEAYAAATGDAHVGFRDGDDAELARWAAKQRAAKRAGALPPDQEDKLRAAGFEFDAEAAEWLRWFNEIAAVQAAAGHCSPAPLASGADFLLLNWCSVQRIAKRSRVLSPERAAMLDGLGGWDWTGADALS